MTYEAVEAGLATQIRALAAFDDDQVSLGDWLILGYGHSVVAILEYFNFDAERDSSDQDSLFTWVIRVHLLTRYTDDATANNVLRDRRDDIIMKILQNPTLGDTAFDSMPIRGGRMEEEYVIGNINFLHEFLDVQIEERVNA